MRKLDLYWTDNPDWWYRDENGVRHIKEDAPEDAKKSYEHYLEQQKRHEETLKRLAYMAYV